MNAQYIGSTPGLSAMVTNLQLLARLVEDHFLAKTPDPDNLGFQESEMRGFVRAPQNKTEQFDQFGGG